MARPRHGAGLGTATSLPKDMMARTGAPAVNADIRSTTGAQAVDRALALLRLVAAAPGEGLRLADLADAIGLDRTTVHRLLSSLAGNALVDQDAVSKRYTLGLDFFSLAAAASNRHDVAEFARASLKTLSADTGDTATLCLRSGVNLVCTDVATGNFPIKTLPMDIGSRRPLGAGAPGVAMLAALPDFEVEQVLDKVEPRLADVPGQNRAQVLAAVAACRAVGYALMPDEPLGRIVGLAVTLNNRRGRPEGTLTINGIPERFAPERLPLLIAALGAEITAIKRAMEGLPDSARRRSRWADTRI